MSPQLIERQLNQQEFIRIPLARSMSDLGINLIKRECGFPENWSHIDIGAWLAEYDYIPFSRRQMQRQDPHGVIYHYITTNYDPNPNINTNANRWHRDDIVWFNLPIEAFDEWTMFQIAFLINPEFHILNNDAWVRYLLLGGPDRIRIGLKRYDPNIHLHQMFQNLIIHHNDN